MNHFLTMSDKFAVLQDYPKEGPPIPEREKVQRKKDKHDPGNLRRDKTKRGGKGKDNWGTPEDDLKYLNEGLEEDYEEEELEKNSKIEKEDKAPFVHIQKVLENE